MLRASATLSSHADALATVASVIDTIDAFGLQGLLSYPAVVTNDTEQAGVVLTALATLSSTPSTAIMVAEALAEKAYETFAPKVRQFQKDMLSLSGAAELNQFDSLVANDDSALSGQRRCLCTFARQFVAVRAVLLAWCNRLRVTPLAGSLAVRVRCALVQPDVLTSDAPCGGPVLARFLAGYARHLLSLGPVIEDDNGNGQSSSGRDHHSAEKGNGDDGEEGAKHAAHASSGSTGDYVAVLRADPVLAALDELGLSRTPEVRALWRSVLVASIEARVAALEDDFSVPALSSCLCWAEGVLEPFVREALFRNAGSSPNDFGGNDDVNHTISSTGCSAFSSGWQPSVSLPAIAMLSPRPSATTGSAAAAAAAGDLSPAVVRACAELDRLCSEMREHLLLSYARRRTAAFWDILAEYPESTPTLDDLRFCLQFCPHGGIKEELMDHLRGLLAARLHRAGTRTEDVLVMLSKAVHALWVLVPRNEQSAVIFSVVSATLDHLRRRRDCVPAVVQVLTQTGEDTALTPAVGMVFAGVSADADEEAGAFDNGAGGTRERPDILRILLTAIPVRALTEEYQHALAQQLLSKAPHDFDTASEEEVLERLKCVLGGDVLPSCEVMVHDIQTSKRTTNQLRERLAVAPPTRLPVLTTSLNVLSLTVWPKLAHCLPAGELLLPPDAYACHPALQAEMDRIAEAYKELKQGQKLCWVLAQGHVTLEVKQRCGSAPETSELVMTAHTLSLFAASIVLYMMELDVQAGGVPLRLLAAKLDVSVDVLHPHVQRLVPTLLVLANTSRGDVNNCEDAEAGGGGGITVSVQRVLPTSSRVQFGEAGQEAEDASKPKSSLDEDQIALLRTMAVAMLQNSGSAPMADIMNSLKMFTGMDISNADMKHLMHLLVTEGSVVLTDSKAYALA